eukprot:1822270-Prymnesium_polylepis.1
MAFTGGWLTTQMSYSPTCPHTAKRVRTWTVSEKGKCTMLATAATAEVTLTCSIASYGAARSRSPAMPRISAIGNESPSAGPDESGSFSQEG